MKPDFAQPATISWGESSDRIKRGASFGAHIDDILKCTEACFRLVDEVTVLGEPGCFSAHARGIHEPTSDLIRPYAGQRVKLYIRGLGRVLLVGTVSGHIINLSTTATHSPLQSSAIESNCLGAGQSR